ncbi:subtilisin-like serine protease [Purpureocillium lavendulum]|uniref:Subtilisin-like serine protease n=1 Tax=Purpureocillium lavendulum TaxID=1247861 RepID=A0AB34FK55_9HYPO|nr:subtilisin-like serine protease [Purpureocillium lavendulum]
MKLLGPDRRLDDASPSVDNDLASLMPASYRTEVDNLVAVGRCISPSLERELDLHRLDAIHNWLWLAGRLAPPRPLHQQMALGREVIITERMDMHLVWTTGKLFLKPIPRFLLVPNFWAAYLSEPQEQCRGGSNNAPGRLHKDDYDSGLRKRALGFLFSYAALISYESDFHIATAKQLLPAGRDLVEQLDTEHIYLHIDRRFHHGELRLSRLNKIYFLQNPLRGYAPAWDRYSAFFRDYFAWLASVAIYIAIVLAAMQVGLATELGHNDAFQSAAYGFTVFSIVGPLAIVFLIVLAFCVAFTYNWIKAIDYRKRRTGTILQRPAGP